MTTDTNFTLQAQIQKKMVTVFFFYTLPYSRLPFYWIGSSPQSHPPPSSELGPWLWAYKVPQLQEEQWWHLVLHLIPFPYILYFWKIIPVFLLLFNCCISYVGKSSILKLFYNIWSMNFNYCSFFLDMM